MFKKLIANIKKYLSDITYKRKLKKLRKKKDPYLYR